MKPMYPFILILLGAIWGGSALCMKLLSPSLAPELISVGRLVVACLFFLVMQPFSKAPLHLRTYWKKYLVLGALNGSIPYFLFAYAAHDLTASILSVLNTLTPMWGFVLGFLLRLHPVSLSSALGLAMGISGVVILLGFDLQSTAFFNPISIVVILLATLSYSLGALYSKSFKNVDPWSAAHGSMWGACLLSSFSLLWADLPTHVASSTWIALLMLGVICTGFAAFLFFKLLKVMDSTAVLAVSFLIPIFGIFWGFLFLDEKVGWSTLIGVCVTLLGTALVTGFTTLKSLKQHGKRLLFLGLKKSR